MGIGESREDGGSVCKLPLSRGEHCTLYCVCSPKPLKYQHCSPAHQQWVGGGGGGVDNSCGWGGGIRPRLVGLSSVLA